MNQYRPGASLGGLFVSFASEDLRCYRTLQTWALLAEWSPHTYDAHDFATASNLTKPEEVRRRLQPRVESSFASLLLLSGTVLPKSLDPMTFFYFEVEALARARTPVVASVVPSASAVGWRSLVPPCLLGQVVELCDFSEGPLVRVLEAVVARDVPLKLLAV